jgi:AcrR family transcriptional regulator
VSHRDRLLEGARQCLREKGYAATTARDIVAASDTNLASIGYHFGSKEALLQAALEDGFLEWTEFIGSVAFAAPDATPAERLRTSWAAMMESFDESRPLLVAWVESLAPTIRSDDLREQFAAYMRETRAQVQRLVDAALGDVGVDTKPIASLLMALCDGLVIQWLIEPGEAPSADEVFDSLSAVGESLVALVS